MKIYVHIGFSKTGSTTLQSFLENNLKALMAEQRALVLTGLGQRANSSQLAMYGMTPDASDLQRNHLLRLHKVNTAADHANVCRHVEATLESAIAEHQPESLIISSELLSQHLAAEHEITRVADLLRRHSDDIKIIAYVRRQDQRWVSSYSQRIKGGLTQPFSAKTGRRFLDYKSTLDSWRNVFGQSNMLLGVLERSSLKGGDLVEDFMLRIGLAHAALARPAMMNESLCTEAAEFLRLLNEHVPVLDPNTGQPNELRTNLVPALERWGSKRPRQSLSAKERWDIMQQAEAYNAAIAREYLGREDGRLFLEMPAEAGETPSTIAAAPPPLTIETAVTLSGYLWNLQKQRILQLQAEVKELRAEARHRPKAVLRPRVRPGTSK